MRRFQATRRGFTLIEVMAAITFLTVGMMAAFYLLGVGTSVNTDSKITALAYQAAQQELEILRNTPYSTLATISRSTEGAFVKPDGTADASRPGDSGYPGLVSGLARLPSGRGGLIITGTDSRKVTVVVRWLDPGAISRKVVVGTIVAEGGINPR